MFLFYEKKILEYMSVVRGGWQFKPQGGTVPGRGGLIFQGGVGTPLHTMRGMDHIRGVALNGLNLFRRLDLSSGLDLCMGFVICFGLSPVVLLDL